MYLALLVINAAGAGFLVQTGHVGFAVFGVIGAIASCYEIIKGDV